MKRPYYHLLLIAVLLVPLGVRGQELPIKAFEKIPVAKNLPSKIATGTLHGAPLTALTNAERFVLPAFDLTSPVNLATTLKMSENKHLLNTHTFYTQHNAQALQTLQEIHSFVTSPHMGKGSPYLIRRVQSFVKDPYLLQTMEQSLTAHHYENAMRDLADFYGLSTEFIPQTPTLWATTTPEEVFVRTTLDYLEQHPHKVSLQLREILKDPEVASFKTPISKYIHQSLSLTPQDKVGLANMLRNVYHIHNHSLKQAYQSAEVRITISFYNKALTELENFVHIHRRRPRWDGPMEERRLYNQLLVITKENPSNFFVEATQPLQAIQDILAQYPPILYSWESTLQRIEQFIQKNGFYPRSYNKSNGNTTEEELELLDHVTHHTFVNPLLYKNIEELKAKYNLPLE